MVDNSKGAAPMKRKRRRPKDLNLNGLEFQCEDFGSAYLIWYSQDHRQIYVSDMKRLQSWLSSAIKYLEQEKRP
jgi:hypothetical protein